MRRIADLLKSTLIEHQENKHEKKSLKNPKMRTLHCWQTYFEVVVNLDRAGGQLKFSQLKCNKKTKIVLKVFNHYI